MALTQNFGLTKFASEGRISDDGYKFSNRDRDLIDNLLWTLFNHDHQAGATALTGPTVSGESYLDLTLSITGGTLPPNSTYYYKYSFMDSNGNETEASAATSIATPNAQTPPPAMTLATATTGGSLDSGTYRYALSYYQSGGGETTAPNTNSIVVPTGTTTNTITITLDALPGGMAGWKVYRKSPADDNYYLLATVASGATEYVDDGFTSPDCTKKRPTRNSTNSTNKVTISIPAADLPLPAAVTAWRIYRTSVPGYYPANSLLATVTETTTEGGSDLVTTYEDTGQALSYGVPLSQSATPPTVPSLDPSRAFDTTRRLPAAIQPQGVQQFYTYLPGTLAAQTYNQFYIPNDMALERLDAYFLTGPTGVDGSNYITIRVSDDVTIDEVQTLWNNATADNEVQFIYNNATGGTFTLSFDGQGPTAALAYDAPATGTGSIEEALELLSNITDVQVTGQGTAANPWIIEFVNPGSQSVAQITADDTLLTGGTTTIFTSIEGSNGGTFTLSDGTDTTSAIAYNASAATIETRLETDITAITNVTVTGSGTQNDPWVITWVDPGGTDADLLIVNDTSLNGVSIIEETTRGKGVTQVDLNVQATGQYHFWQSPTTDAGTYEAEDGTGGVQVSDQLAGNDVAMELDTQNETNSVTVGTLDEGSYIAYFYVADRNQSDSFSISVIDTTGPTTIATRTISDLRPVYTPGYELSFTSAGTENFSFQVEKLGADTDPIRVDRYEYEAQLPTLKAGGTGTLEVIVTGSPTTNGDDVQVNLWY